MEYQDFPLQEQLHSQLYMFNSTMDGLSNDMIDPDLKHSNTNPHGFAPWSPHQPQRFMTEHHKMPYSNYSQFDSMYGQNLRQSDGITPLPSALLPRQGSPSDHPSSVCSSTLSPLGDSDCGLDHLPSTPPDDLTLSPYHSPHGSWGSLAGLTSVCVTPGDVNPYQESPIFGDDRSPHFPGREFSMSSHGSYDLDQFSQTEYLPMPRQMSPTEFGQEIKDEIQVSDQPSREIYPQIESDHDEERSEVDGGSIEVAYIEKDDEYKPARSNKRTNSTASRVSKSRKRSVTSQPAQAAKKAKLESDNASGNRQSNKVSSQGTKSNFPCKECHDISFKDASSLEKHTKQQHTRPFVCVFSFAGCTSTFAAKNEWKRHVASQHLVLNYWLCDQDACAKISNSPGTKSGAKSRAYSNSSQTQGAGFPQLPPGAIFNRKDLYTQHLRRMHIPPNVKKQVKQKKAVPEWEERVREHQDSAHRLRCELPTHMTCPATGCNVQFNGPQAWDERMEHVAKHLEKAAADSESPIVFGGEHDETLTYWAARLDVSVIVRDEKGKWNLRNPFKPERSPTVQASENGDEDAEGEEVDD